MSLYKYLLCFSISGIGFVLDQITKIYIHTQMMPGEQVIPVIPHFFNIQYVRNQGGAFGLFSDSHPYIRTVLFLLFPLFCVYLIFSLLRETQDKLQITGLGLILGGALGNYVDRLRLGYVVDFIDWYVGDFHWPTFNLADSFIVVGVIILSYLFFLDSRKSSV